MFQTTNEVAGMQAPSRRREAGSVRCGSLLLATVLLSSTVACGATMSETSKPDYRENPAPERIHGIEVSIEDAPGEFRYDWRSHGNLLPESSVSPASRSTTVDPFVIGRAGREAMAHVCDDELFKVRLVLAPTP